ncbi:MAG TPA: plastocyanin/azurin family copper-binding protein [Acidimicrobiales bacterium]|nr:plastocyanin/azurin family copper-binding protein [Acidimicrobiales bacterium]
MPARCLRYLSLAMFLSTVALTGCAGSDNDAPPELATDGSSVAVVDNDFEPAALRVKVGQEVTWSWEGDNPHDVRFDDFASPVQTSGRFTHTFDRTGTFRYVCTVHSGMRGTIEVEAS